jgi:hypothetical protein
MQYVNAYTLRCDAVRCGAVRCGAMRCVAVNFAAALCHNIRAMVDVFVWSSSFQQRLVGSDSD